MNKIGPIEFFLRPDVAKSLSLCPAGCLSLEKLNWDSQQGRDLATSGRNKKISIGPVWYHQIWIQTYLGFMVLILITWRTFRFHYYKNASFSLFLLKDGSHRNGRKIPQRAKERKVMVLHMLPVFVKPEKPFGCQNGAKFVLDSL